MRKNAEKTGGIVENCPEQLNFSTFPRVFNVKKVEKFSVLFNKNNGGLSGLIDDLDNPNVGNKVGILRSIDNKNERSAARFAPDRSFYSKRQINCRLLYYRSFDASLSIAAILSMRERDTTSPRS